jgi:hypothetical protein
MHCSLRPSQRVASTCSNCYVNNAAAQSMYIPAAAISLPAAELQAGASSRISVDSSPLTNTRYPWRSSWGPSLQLSSGMLLYLLDPAQTWRPVVRRWLCRYRMAGLNSGPRDREYPTIYIWSKKTVVVRSLPFAF